MLTRFNSPWNSTLRHVGKINRFMYALPRNGKEHYTSLERRKYYLTEYRIKYDINNIYKIKLIISQKIITCLTYNVYKFFETL